MEIRKLEDGRLLIARGDFCSCSSEKDPNYFFYSRRMIVEPDKSVVAQPVVLNIAEVPVAVLPILVYPLESGRRSGFLAPNFGGDQAQGFYLRDFGYYWAISEYMDWKIAADIVEGENATFDKNNAATSFHYKKRYWLDGSINAKAYLDKLGASGYGWDIHYNHNQKLTPDGRMTIKGSGSFVSSTDLRQSKGLEKETVLDQQANAQMTFRKQWQNNATFTARVSQQKNLRPVLIDGEEQYKTTRELPDLLFNISGNIFPRTEEEELDTLLEPSWYNKLGYRYSAQANSFTREVSDTTTRDTSWIGIKDNINLRYSGSLFEVINVTPQVNLQNFWSDQHWTSIDTTTQALNNDSTSRKVNSSFSYHDQHFARFNTSLNTNTKMYGIWKPEWGRFTGIRHTITPNLGVRYAPEFGGDKQFRSHPTIHPSTTRQEEQKTLTMALGNDFDLKYIEDLEEDAEGVRKPKYENLKLFDLKSSTSKNFAADSLHWAPINSNIGLQVTPRYRFNINTIHSVYRPYSSNRNQRVSTVQLPELQRWSFNFSRNLSWSGKFNSGQSSSRDKYKMDPWSAGVSYDYRFSSSRISANAWRKDIRHSSSMNFSIHPTPNWKMKYNTHYNFDLGEFAEHAFSFERSLGCWKMYFKWTPIGPSEGWSFKVFIVDLPDIKLEAGDDKLTSGRR
jgi:hypothetical protein